MTGSQFIQLTEGEERIAEYEVISVERQFSLGQLFNTLVLGAIGVGGLSLLMGPATYEHPWIGSFGLVLPLMYALAVILRPREKGYLYLTNRRLIYYHRKQGFLSNEHHVYDIKVQDVAGLTVQFEKNWTTETAHISIITKFKDWIQVNTRVAGVFLIDKIPILGSLGRFSNKGKDIDEAARALYRELDAVRSA